MVTSTHVHSLTDAQVADQRRVLEQTLHGRRSVGVVALQEGAEENGEQNVFLFGDRFERQIGVEQAIDAVDVRFDEGFLLRFDVMKGGPGIQKGMLPYR